MSAELIKEIKKELPEGWAVRLDTKTSRYAIEELEKEQRADEGESRKEKLAAFDKKVTDEMKKLLKQGVFPAYVLSGLAGINTPEAWKLRNELKKHYPQSVASSLAGINTPEAWKLRNELKNDYPGFVALSLAGVDTPEAWEMRNELKKGNPDSVARSLAGVDTPEAWKLRNELRNDYPYYVARGLAGVDTPEAWKLRNELKKEIPDSVVLSLAGVDTPEAWKLRNELKKGYPDSVARSLAGIDTPEAWEMRNELKKGNPDSVARSLAGVDTPEAWEMRNELKKKHPADVALGLSGDDITFVWRLRPEWKEGGLKVESRKSTVKERNREKREKLAAFDKKVTDEMERFLEQGVDPMYVLSGLAGVDTPEAWKLRNELKNDYPGFVAQGLAGVDTPEAWKLRNELKNEDPGFVAQGLAGVDTPEAWKLRNELKNEDPGFVAQGLAGINTPEAWKLRNELKNEDPGSVALSLAGINTPEAWKLRNELKSEDPGFVAQSLAGINTPEAWKLRNELKNDLPRSVALSLAGVDTPEAWKLRREIMKKHPDFVAESLAGINTPEAWKLRNELKKSYPVDVAFGLSGDCTTFVWRLRPEWKLEDETVGGEFERAEELVDLLNLVRNPELKDVQAYLDAHKPSPEQQKQREREKLARSPLALRFLTDTSKMDLDTARAYLRTNAAVVDRAPDLLAELLIHRMMPYRTAPNTTSMWDRFTGIFGGKRGEPLRGNPETALLDNPLWEMMGGGGESLSDTRKVLECREPMDALLTTGIYGRYSKQFKRWEKTFFPVHREPMPPTKETTITLTSAKPGSRVLLPMPTDARLIPERIRAVTKFGKEIPMQAEVNSLGEATAEVPKGAVKVLYSIERELAFQPMEDIDKKEYAAFKKRFEKDYGTDLSSSLARLPQDMLTDLRSKEFLALSLKEKVIRIEEMVRSLGYYDVSNDEVSRQKLGKTVEEQIMMSEMRLTELRNKSDDKSKFKGKRFAGVCADYAQIVCAALREAGIAAGILAGFSMRGKEAQMRNSHATAFVPWPTADGDIRVIPIDGTPSEGAEGLARVIGLSRPSLSELEKKSEAVVSEQMEQAQEVVEQLLKDIGAGDVAAIRKLDNSVLERALNLILSYEVKRSNVRAISRMLGAYWYGPIHKLEGRRRDIEMQEALEDEIMRERKETPSADELATAGTDLMKTIRSYLTKFERAGKEASSKEGLDLLERITKLAKKELNQTEQRAMAAVIGYLRAKKMR